MHLIRSRWVALMMVIVFIFVTIPVSARPKTQTTEPTVFLPLATTACSNKELYQQHTLSRYLVFCEIPKPYWIIYNYPDPDVRVEWFLQEHPSVAGDTLWWSIPEPAQLDSNGVQLMMTMAKARAELERHILVSATTTQELLVIAKQIRHGDISPQQAQLALGLVFLGPPGWIVAGVVIAVSVAVVTYVILKNTQGVHTGIDWQELNQAHDHEEELFSLDQLEQEVAEGTQTTSVITRGEDHFLEGPQSRVSQRRQLLQYANEVLNVTKPRCQHRDDPNGGTTALWFITRGGRHALFLHRHNDPNRDSGMFRPRQLSYPRHGNEYSDLPDTDKNCEEARVALLWRIACYLFGLECDRRPW